MQGRAVDDDEKWCRVDNGKRFPGGISRSEGEVVRVG